MNTQEVLLPLPENLYVRLQHVAQATDQSLTDILIHAIEVGSPPAWEDAPVEFQADLSALDRLNDEALWRLARSRQTEAEMARYYELLEKNSEGDITPAERAELTYLRTEADRFMLRKAQAAALLRWRGYQLPPAENL